MEDVIVFDNLESRKSSMIHNILTIIDVVFDPEKKHSRIRDRVRKVVLDEANDFYRYVLGEMSGK